MMFFNSSVLEESLYFGEIDSSKKSNQMRCATAAAIVLAVCLVAAAFFAISIFFPVIAIPIVLKIVAAGLSLTIAGIAGIILFDKREQISEVEEDELTRTIKFENAPSRRNSMDGKSIPDSKIPLTQNGDFEDLGLVEF